MKPVSNAKGSLTTRDVCLALMIVGDEELDGDTIANALLNGEVTFLPHELDKLAAYKDMTVMELVKYDKRLQLYSNYARAKTKKDLLRQSAQSRGEAAFANELKAGRAGRTGGSGGTGGAGHNDGK